MKSVENITELLWNKCLNQNILTSSSFRIFPSGVGTANYLCSDLCIGLWHNPLHFIQTRDRLRDPGLHPLVATLLFHSYFLKSNNNTKNEKYNILVISNTNTLYVKGTFLSPKHYILQRTFGFKLNVKGEGLWEL